MRYYKIIDNGYILGIGAGSGGTEITQEEYDAIMSAIQSRPSDTDTTGYRLTTALTWESYEKDPVNIGLEEVDADEIASALEGIL